MLGVGTAVLFSFFLARWPAVPERLATLAGVGSSVCGVSTIMAAGLSVDATERALSRAGTAIQLFRMVTTFTHPHLARFFPGHDDVRAGIFIGTPVHEAGASLSSRWSGVRPWSL